MPLTFKITEVETLTRAGLGVLGGIVVSGTVKTGAQAELVHGDRHFPVEIKGVVLNREMSGGKDDVHLSLSLDLRVHGVRQARAGDLLVSG